MDGATLQRGRPDRPSISLPCLVDLGGTAFQAQLVDIGFGGLGLVLPGDAELLEPGMLCHVVIGGIGEVEVECRWRRGDRIGAQFVDEDAVQGRIEAFLAEYGLTAA